MDLGRAGALRTLWSEADNLRERVAEAPALYAFFSFDAALAQRASHGHLRTNPASRAALIRLCAAPDTRAGVFSNRKVELLQRRLRLHRLAYVGVHGADVQAFGLRLVTEPDREMTEGAVQKLRRTCIRQPALHAAGIAIEDRTWSLVLHLRHANQPASEAATETFSALVAGEGLRLRRGEDTLEACAQSSSSARSALGLLAGFRNSLGVYVGAGEADEEAFQAVRREGGITVLVGPAPRAGTAASYQVADTGEVIRLIHWLADARRR